MTESRKPTSRASAIRRAVTPLVILQGRRNGKGGRWTALLLPRTGASGHRLGGNRPSSDMIEGNAGKHQQFPISH